VTDAEPGETVILSVEPFYGPFPFDPADAPMAAFTGGPPTYVLVTGECGHGSPTVSFGPLPRVGDVWWCARCQRGP
jgi:hypothetical protein